MPKKTFVSNEILTASDVNTYLMDQAVMVFDSASARNTALPSPTEGMVVYLKDTDALQKRTASAWVDVNTDSGKISQVVSATKTDTFSASTTSYTNITGLSASITPASTSSKILVMTDIKVSVRDDNGQGVFVRLSGGNSTNYVGAASGSKVQAASGWSDRQGDFAFSRSAVPISLVYLDSPSTTGSVTYNAQIRSADGSIAYVNRSFLDVNSTRGIRTASSITVMEVAG